MSNRTSEMKRRLLQERDALLRQRDAIDGEIKGIERAIALFGAEPTSGGKVQIKTIVLQLLEEARRDGLDASIAVSQASERGISLDRSSVSSLLSRLTRDDVIIRQGGRYRLKKYSDGAIVSLPSFSVSGVTGALKARNEGSGQ